MNETTYPILTIEQAEEAVKNIQLGQEGSPYLDYTLPETGEIHCPPEDSFKPVGLGELFAYCKVNGEKIFLGYILRHRWNEFKGQALVNLAIPELVCVPANEGATNSFQSFVVYRLDHEEGLYKAQQYEEYGTSALYYAQEDYLGRDEHHVLWMPHYVG